MKEKRVKAPWAFERCNLRGQDNTPTRSRVIHWVVWIQSDSRHPIRWGYLFCKGKWEPVKVLTKEAITCGKCLHRMSLEVQKEVGDDL